MHRDLPAVCCIGLLLLSAAVLAAEQLPPGQQPADKERTHVETITQSRHAYTVAMGGLFDGVMTRDHDLVKRHHTYGVLSAHSRSTDEFSASLFCYEDPGGKYNPSLTHTMDLTLRPGEAIEWGWGHDKLKFHGRGNIEGGWGKVARARACHCSPS